MANISLARGFLEIPNDFYKQYQKLINEAPSLGEYGIYFDEIEVLDEVTIINWTGYGRWNMEFTLEWCLTETEAGQKLVEFMIDKEIMFKISYEDYEPGNCIFVHEEGELAPKRTNRGYKLEVHVNTENLVYNDCNLIREGFESGSIYDDWLLFQQDETLIDLGNLPVIKASYPSEKDFLERLWQYVQSEELAGGICDWRFEAWYEEPNDLLNEIK